MNKGSRIKYYGHLGTVDDIVFLDGKLHVIATLDNGQGASGLGSEFTLVYFTAKS